MSDIQHQIIIGRLAAIQDRLEALQAAAQANAARLAAIEGQLNGLTEHVDNIERRIL